MYHIETKLTEERFLHRLQTLCFKKTLSCSEYYNRDAFILKRRSSRFRIGKSSVHTIIRGPACANECLICTYTVGENGHVSVDFRFGKWAGVYIIRLAMLIPFAVMLFCFIDGIVSFSETEWGLLAGAAVFLAASLFTFGRSKEQNAELEAHLRRICLPGSPHSAGPSD